MNTVKEILEAVEGRNYLTGINLFEGIKSDLQNLEGSKKNELIGGVLKAYQFTEQHLKGWELIINIDYSLDESDTEYSKICFGWFLIEILKKSSQTANSFIKTVVLQKYVINSIQVLSSQITKHKNIISQLITKILKNAEAEKFTDHLLFNKILNAIQIRTEEGISFIRNDHYIISSFITFLRKSGNPKKAWDLIHYLKISFSSTDSVFLINSWGWLLYDLLKQEMVDSDFPDDSSETISTFMEHEAIIIEQINENEGRKSLINDALSLLPLLQENPNQFSPFSKLLQLYVKFEKQQQKSKIKANFHPLNKFLLALNPDKLNCVPITFEYKKNGKTVTKEGASDLETWYSGRIRATFEIGEYKNCIDLVSKALSEIQPLHYSNQIWFQRYQALSYQKEGNLSEAEILFRKITKQKNDWFILAEFANLLLEIENFDESLHIALKAKNSSNDLKFQINLLPLIGQILEKKNETTLAYFHFRFAKLFRENQGWNVPNWIIDIYYRLDSQMMEEDRLNIFELKKELEKFWRPKNNSSSPKNHQIAFGKITKINHQKGFGFIKSKDGEDFYFHFKELKFSPAQLQIGSGVQFNIKDSPQEGKFRIAIKIIEKNKKYQ